MNAKLLAPLGLVAALALAYWLTAPLEDASGRRDAPQAAARPVSDPAPTVAASPPLESARSEAPPASAPSPTPSPSRPVEPATAALVRGRVIDAHGLGVADVAIALEVDGPGATPVMVHSAGDGSFELPGTHRGRLVAADERWTTLMAGVPVDARAGQECRIVVAPRIALAGLVLDAQGTPVAGALLSLTPPLDLRARLAQVLDFSADRTSATKSDEFGQFRLDPAPALEDARLTVERDGFLSLEEAAPTRTLDNLVLVLRRPGAGEGLLAGTVVDATGAPVAGALVALGFDGTTSDAEGRFRIQSDDPASPNRQAESRGLSVRADRLRALKPGHLPAELAARREADGRLVWPQPLVLVLEGEPLAIEGRVVDERGEGLPGMQVWVANGTFFGGLADPGEGLQLGQVESLLAGAGAGWSFVESDADGRFRLEGLLERDYRVAAMDPATLLRTDIEAVAAGRRDAELVLSRARLLPRLAGRVVNGHGAPIAGVAVLPMCDAHTVEIEGRTVRTQHATVPGTLTDEQGRFVLKSIPEEAVYLRLQGPETIPLEWGRQVTGGLKRLAGEDVEDLLISVEQRCHFRVELEVAGEADELGLLDAEGRELVISEFLGNARNDTERHPLIGGRSSTLAASDRATFVVLYRQGFEVRRAPVRLVPGEPSTLRL
jgi:protocatechuate 3,4-dioxygenase beta subunit